ncbi:unnamed protein product [Rotaria socialis]|uniref:Uncharacterized protein n=1 Tax=Rotaria socialis TaxID=392032 RepID=A0A821RAR2_9BILA|nr:unnamed protein product [Rotaria socialis]CAF3560999.1 unnamed protein product [Rotaria socialis]CAF4317559.1 unnamed protein product [Rotaria socialis]CAF4839645.1 unnamed protein product [Rotaria socialis]
MNYAYGSAKTDSNLVPDVTEMSITAPDVRQQISLHKNNTDLTKINFDQTIYIIWAGANDYFFNLNLSPFAVVVSLMNDINDLIQLSTNHIIIVNQPPFQSYPAVVGLNISSYLNQLTLAHNSNLSNVMQSLQLNFSNVSLELFDVYSRITNILMNSSTYGVNSTKNCWDTSNHTSIQMCSSPDTYIFIGEYHFTTRAHQKIADNAHVYYL